MAIAQFGRFRPDSHRRELLADGMLVPIGSRAFDIFIVLIEGREVVSKDEIMSRAWPGTVVEEHNLQSQISTLHRREIAISSRPSLAAAIASLQTSQRLPTRRRPRPTQAPRRPYYPRLSY
jgi:DNA-binding response OmpR family regulator